MNRLDEIVAVVIPVEPGISNEDREIIRALGPVARLIERKIGRRMDAEEQNALIRRVLAPVGRL